MKAQGSSQVIKRLDYEIKCRFFGNIFTKRIIIRSPCYFVGILYSPIQQLR